MIVPKWNTGHELPSLSYVMARAVFCGGHTQHGVYLWDERFLVLANFMATKFRFVALRFVNVGDSWMEMLLAKTVLICSQIESLLDPTARTMTWAHENEFDCKIVIFRSLFNKSTSVELLYCLIEIIKPQGLILLVDTMQTSQNRMLEKVTDLVK